MKPFAHWISVYEYAKKHDALPSGLGADKVFCSNCESMADKKTPYCPECGRSMLEWPAGWGEARRHIGMCSVVRRCYDDRGRI